LPRLFRKVKLALEELDIAEYKTQLGKFSDDHGFKAMVIRDLQDRRDRVCSEL